MANGASKFKILVVEDNETMREGIVRVVQKMGLLITEVGDGETALAKLTTDLYHILITDYKLPGVDGMEVLKSAKSQSPDTEVLMITAFGTIDLAVEAIRNGASDFIAKPFSPEELTIKINKILERIQEKGELTRIAAENVYLRDEVEVQFNFGEIVGNSSVMQNVYRTIDKVAKGDSSVIIYGESGTGKELVARAIHKASPRSDRAFIRVNCGALAEGVLESELFGHERGAFTGALKRKKGRFELAHQGTIFLDEIGDIALSTQVKLLRVLQEKEFERVGGEETLSVDVRVIAATNKNLKMEIEQGRFREDLFYRLHIIPIHLPPLRERKEDIPLLTEHFMKKIQGNLSLPNLEIEDSALPKLIEYDWPGNIREMENVLERAAVLCNDTTIGIKDLPLLVGNDSHADVLVGTSLDLNRTLESVEKNLLEKAMEESRGNKTEAARLLGVKTSALYYKLEKYGLI